MVDPIDAEKARLIRYLREKAHILNVWMAPRVSKEAMILNAAADAMEACTKEGTQSSVSD